MPLMDMEAMIRKFAKSKRIKEKDYPAFKEKILKGLGFMQLDNDKSDIDKYKAVAKKAGWKQ